MISRSKIAKRLKRDIVKNLYLFCYKEEEKYLKTVYILVDTFIKRFNVQEKDNLRISIELNADLECLIFQNKSRQFDHFIKKEKLEKKDIGFQSNLTWVMCCIYENFKVPLISFEEFKKTAFRILREEKNKKAENTCRILAGKE